MSIWGTWYSNHACGFQLGHEHSKYNGHNIFHLHSAFWLYLWRSFQPSHNHRHADHKWPNQGKFWLRNVNHCISTLRWIRWYTYGKTRSQIQAQRAFRFKTHIKGKDHMPQLILRTGFGHRKMHAWWGPLMAPNLRSWDGCNIHFSGDDPQHQENQRVHWPYGFECTWHFCRTLFFDLSNIESLWSLPKSSYWPRLVNLLVYHVWWENEVWSFAVVHGCTVCRRTFCWAFL